MCQRSESQLAKQSGLRLSYLREPGSQYFATLPWIHHYVQDRLLISDSSGTIETERLPYLAQEIYPPLGTVTMQVLSSRS